jgi:HemX protein
MSLAIDIAFYAAFGLFGAAAVTSYLYLRADKEGMLGVTQRAIGMAAGLLFVAFCLRWASYGRIPLTNMVDIVNLLLVMSTVIVLALVRRDSLRALVCYYAPPLAALSLLNVLLGFNKLHQEPKALNDTFLAIHVGLAFLAYALFLIASLTSFVYIVQARRLKSPQTSARTAKLPPLEHLDATLYRLIAWGYPFFAITLILGFIGAYLYPDELGARWWLSAKIFYAVFMAALYSFSFHSRRLGLLRGQKLAYVMVIGFAVMLAIYMLLGVTGLKDIGFWSTGA